MKNHARDDGPGGGRWQKDAGWGGTSTEACTIGRCNWISHTHRLHTWMTCRRQKDTGVLGEGFGIRRHEKTAIYLLN